MAFPEDEIREDFPELFLNPKAVAWGCVVSSTGRQASILVGNRCSDDDPLRHGQLVIPRGGLEGEEDYVSAAIREVKEVSGVEAECRNVVYTLNDDFLFKCKNQIMCCHSRGFWHLHYKDSKMTYMGKITYLAPMEGSEPVENPQSDMRNPRYISIREAENHINEFTPACQLLVRYEIIPLIGKNFMS